MDQTAAHRSPRHLQVAGFLLGALLLGLFLGLPLGHQLFHELSVEPENCPVHMLESSLVQLAVAAAVAFSVALCIALVQPDRSIPHHLLFAVSRCESSSSAFHTTDAVLCQGTPSALHTSSPVRPIRGTTCDRHFNPYSSSVTTRRFCVSMRAVIRDLPHAVYG